MPKTPEQTKALQQKRKTAIKKAALGLFAQKPLSDINVDEICKASSSSHGLFYHYYSSLEELFLVLLNEAKEDDLPPLDKLSSLQGQEGIDALFSYYERALAENKGALIYYASMSLWVEQEERLIPKVKKRIAVEKTFIRLIKEGQGEGNVIGGDPKELYLAASLLIKEALRSKLEKKKFLSSLDIVKGMLNKAPVH